MSHWSAAFSPAAPQTTDHGKREARKSRFQLERRKDSALALYKAQQSEAYEIVSLLTTVNRDNARSSMHGIPVGLLRRQADSIGLPLYTIDLAPDGTMENYEEAMAAAVGHFRDTGADRFIFGDIFLHDVRSYREKQLSPYGITVVEPLWGKSSAEIMREFLASGLQTVIVTTTADRLGRDFTGRRIDETFVRGPARRRRRMRRKRRVPHIFATPAVVPHARAVRARRTVAAQVPGQTGRRHGKKLRLLVRRHPGRLIRPRAPTLSFSLAGNNTYLRVLL
ncbi:MAG: hypothetical protein ACLUEV_08235 [Alistipes sp.]